MHAPVDDTPLRRHTLMLSGDVGTVEDVLRAKAFDISLSRPQEEPQAARINAIDLPRLHLCYVAYGTEAMAVTRAPGDVFRLQLPLAGSATISVGARELACHGNQGIVLAPRQEHRVLTDAPCRRLLMYVGEQVLMQQLNALLGDAVRRPVAFDPVLDVEDGAGASFRRWLSLAVAEFDRGDALINNPLALSRFEDFLLTGLLLTQPHRYSGALDGGGNILPRSIKRAIAYLEAHVGEPVTIADLVAATGTPGRTLFKHFRAATGFTPFGYLRKLRYERVRAALVADSDATVAAIAGAFGFTHLGRFAEGYRAAFGELPSQTLRRAQPVPGFSGNGATNGGKRR
jgi:AraC-like DNA-binding protein